MTTCSNLSHVNQKETYSISVSYEYVQTCRVNFCDNENRRTNWRRWNVLKSNRLKKFNRVYIDEKKNCKDDLIVFSKNTAHAKYNSCQVTSRHFGRVALLDSVVYYDFQNDTSNLTSISWTYFWLFCKI